MSLNFRIVLKTFVGVVLFSSLVNAAPSATVQHEPTREMGTQVLPQNPLEGAAISSPQSRMSQTDLRLDWERIWRLTSVQFGYVSGNILASTDEKTESWALGLTRTNYNRNDSAQEYGLNLISNDAFQLYWSSKIFDYHSGWTRFTKYGLALNAETRDGLANPLDPDRYALMLGLGLEESRTYRSSFRPDFTVLYGSAGLAFQFSVLIDVQVLESLAVNWW